MAADTRTAALIVSAYLRNNQMSAAEVPALIRTVSDALGRLDQPSQAPEAPAPQPAVNPKRSVFPDFILSLEDGKRYKSLKRHLMSKYGLTPQQYREKWGLDPSYPMVAPNYAASRSELAKKLGLGRKPRAADDAAAGSEEPSLDLAPEEGAASAPNEAPSGETPKPAKRRGRPPGKKKTEG